MNTTETVDRKILELSGTALDWAVAKAQRIDCINFQQFFVTLDPIVKLADWDDAAEYSPSTKWAQGGPIVQDNAISVEFTEDEEAEGWLTYIDNEGELFPGRTALEAVMRCFVGSKFGSSVNIPVLLAA